MPAMTALPVAPNRNDPDTFADRADAMVAALPGFVSEANALSEDVTAKSAVCTSAAMAVAVTGWVSGTTYAQGVNVWDPVTLLTYRRKVAGAGTTRPALDPTNWALLTGFGDVDTGSAQTITGQKTFAQEILGTARDCSRAVTGTGLASGGGELDADRAINVAEATAEDVRAGTGAGVVTARLGRDLINGLACTTFTYDFSVNGAASIVSFTGLAGFKRVEFNLEVSLATAQVPYLQFSNDNGASYLTTGYQGGAVDGTSNSSATSGLLLHRTSTTRVIGSGVVNDFGVAKKTVATAIAGNGSDRVCSSHTVYNTEQAHNALRFSLGDNTTAGRIVLRGYTNA